MSVKCRAAALSGYGEHSAGAVRTEVKNERESRRKIIHHKSPTRQKTEQGSGRTDLEQKSSADEREAYIGTLSKETAIE